MTDIFIFPSFFSLYLSIPRLSSSSIPNGTNGTTPSTGISVSFSIISIPEVKRLLSPLNLFIITPFIRFLSFSSRSITVPYMAANTPPLSISATRSTGESAISAIPVFTISSSFRLISAGLPAPSRTHISKFSLM